MSDYEDICNYFGYEISDPDAIDKIIARVNKPGSYERSTSGNWEVDPEDLSVDHETRTITLSAKMVRECGFVHGEDDTDWRETRQCSGDTEVTLGEILPEDLNYKRPLDSLCKVWDLDRIWCVKDLDADRSYDVVCPELEEADKEVIAHNRRVDEYINNWVDEAEWELELNDNLIPGYHLWEMELDEIVAGNWTAAYAQDYCPVTEADLWQQLDDWEAMCFDPACEYGKYWIRFTGEWKGH